MSNIGFSVRWIVGIGLLVWAVPFPAFGWIANDMFEGATIAPWQSFGAAGRIRGINLPIPPGAVPAAGIIHVGAVLPPGGVLWQKFDCRPGQDPLPDNFCKVTFTARFLQLRASDHAVVLLKNANGMAAGDIPGGNPSVQGTYWISTQACVNPTTVAVYIVNVNNLPVKSLVVVDNFSNGCLEGAGETNLPAFEPSLLAAIPSDDYPQYALQDYPLIDCNRNGYHDYQDILDGTSPDADGNLVPDECAGIPTVSQWGLIVLTLLLLTAATILFTRRRAVTTTP